ncbi:MAG: O-antigen ligase family protein [bacterium]|nr:O-antigen ligase family protein [bacterium]
MPNWVYWTIGFILILPILIIPPNFQPSDWTRVMLFKVALTALISFFLYRFFYKKDMSFSLPKKGFLFYLPILALIAYFAVLVLSTIFSQDPGFSIFGSPPRSGGILNVLFFLLFAVFLAIFIKGGFWDTLIKIHFTAGVLASLLGIVQYFGLLGKTFLGFETGATPSFLGNSTFLAIYMIFLVFSSFTFFILKTAKKERMIYGSLFLLFLFTVFITSSRASYLGILASFTFYFLFFPKKLIEGQHTLISFITPKRLKRFKIASAFFIGLVVLALVYVNISPKLPGFIENNEKLSFFVRNRLSLNIVAEDLTGTRFSAWQITLSAIKEKPLLGWGPENFHIGFEKYFDPTLPPSLQRLWWDRPHNVYLEVLVNSGIFALIFYIAFWVILVWQLQKIKRQGNPALADEHLPLKAHGLQAMFMGYLVVLFFNFDSFSTYLISFFFIGYALYLISLTMEKGEILPSIKPIPLKKPIAFTFLAAMLLFSWFWNIKPLYINEKIVLVKNLSDSKQCNKALQRANNTDWNKSGIIKPYAALNYSDVVKSCTFVQPEKEVEYSKKAASLLKIASDVQPKFSRTWLFMGAFANVLGAREESKDEKSKLLTEARGYLEKAIALSPKRQEMLIELEKNYMLAEDYQSMVTVAKDCIKIDPGNGECYWYLGIAQIFMGKQIEGKKNIQLSKEKNYGNPHYLQLGVAYMSQKNYKDAADAYSILTSIYPDNAGYHATLAVLYKEIKNYERARMEVMKVFELQPENPETLEFVRLLLGLNPNDVNLHSSLAFIYQQLGDNEKTTKELLIIKSYYLELIAKDPKSPDSHLSLAIIYQGLEDYKNSFKEAVIALNLSVGLKKEDAAKFILNVLPGGKGCIELSYQIKQGGSCIYTQ